MQNLSRYPCSLFLFLTRNTHFEVVLVKKFKIVCLKGNLLPRLIRICGIQFSGDVHFICFLSDLPFFGKFGRKNHNCQFKQKFDTETVFTFSVLDGKCLFSETLVQKIIIVSLNRNLVRRR